MRSLIVAGRCKNDRRESDKSWSEWEMMLVIVRQLEPLSLQVDAGEVQSVSE